MTGEQPVPEATEQPERPGRKPGSGTRSGRPWWTRTPRGTAPQPEPPPNTHVPAAMSAEEAGRPAATWMDRREPILQALDVRIEPLEALLRRALDELASARGALDGFAERTTTAFQSLAAAAEAARTEGRAHRDEGARRAEEAAGHLDETAARLGAASREAYDRVLAEVREAEERLGGRLNNAWETLWAHVESEAKTASDTVSAELAGFAESLRSNVSASAEAVGAELRAGLEGLKSDLAGTPTPEDLVALRSAVREAASDARAAAETARDRIEALVARAERSFEQAQARAEALVQHIARSTQALEAGFARVDRLASIVESLGRRRGFQELVASEERLREEQGAFVRDLAEASERVADRVEALGHRIEALEGHLEAATAEAVALRTLPENVSGTLSVQAERLRERMEETLQARFARDVERSTQQLRAELERGVPVTDTLRELRALASTQQELARAEERMEQAAAGLREELAGLRKRIDGWGRSGSAPRLAQELQSLEGRVGELEARLADGLPEQIARQVSTEVLEALQSKRRGLWRR